MMKDDAEKILAAGCDGYIAKPIDIVDFLGEMARFRAPVPPDYEQPVMLTE